MENRSENLQYTRARASRSLAVISLILVQVRLQPIAPSSNSHILQRNQGEFCDRLTSILRHLQTYEVPNLLQLNVFLLYTSRY